MCVCGGGGERKGREEGRGRECSRHYFTKRIAVLFFLYLTWSKLFPGDGGWVRQDVRFKGFRKKDLPGFGEERILDVFRSSSWPSRELWLRNRKIERNRQKRSC